MIRDDVLLMWSSLRLQLLSGLLVALQQVRILDAMHGENTALASCGCPVLLDLSQLSCVSLLIQQQQVAVAARRIDGLPVRWRMPARSGTSRGEQAAGAHLHEHMSTQYAKRQ